jgi:hypothetical protein
MHVVDPSSYSRGVVALNRWRELWYLELSGY